MRDYQGKEPDKWLRIQYEINEHKVIPPNFAKTPQEKIDLANAKAAYRRARSLLK